MIGEIREKFERDSKIVVQGTKGDTFYIIYDGQCEVIINGETKATLSKPNFFGERALLTSEPRSATVRVSSTSVVAEPGCASIDGVEECGKATDVTVEVIVQQCEGAGGAQRLPLGSVRYGKSRDTSLHLTVPYSARVADTVALGVPGAAATSRASLPL